MPNMSYCRFQNTLSDLRDCMNHLEDDPEQLSPEEREARERLIVLCNEIASDYSDEYGYED